MAEMLELELLSHHHPGIAHGEGQLLEELPGQPTSTSQESVGEQHGQDQGLRHSLE